MVTVGELKQGQKTENSDTEGSREFQRNGAAWSRFSNVHNNDNRIWGLPGSPGHHHPNPGHWPCVCGELSLGLTGSGQARYLGNLSKPHEDVPQPLLPGSNRNLGVSR